MKGREGKGPPPSTDLLVCFPSRAHLTLMPKAICSPARPLSSDTTKRRRHNHHHLKKSTSSPLLWAKMTTSTKPISKEDTLISEPTSPKVTCAGQIKVRSKPSSTTTTATGSSCKNWQSVMEEIERLHNNNNNKKKKKKKKSKSAAAWVESLGFKKDAMQFLTCLRNIRFDFRCFGSFPTSAGITSDDDDDEDDDEEDEESEEEEEKNCRESRISSDVDGEGETSRTVFSKWFMVLQEENSKNGESNNKSTEEKEEEEDAGPQPPPPNALLLMRCRSAPAKSWLEQRHQLALENNNHEENQKQKQKQKEDEDEDEEKEEMEKENLVVMRYGGGIDDDLYKISTDIAKETWIVGGISRDPLIKRSRSWKK